MDFFKATDGRHWYLSIDGGESFELCQREPFLNNEIATPLDEVPLNDPQSGSAELTLSAQQLEERGFTITQMTG